MKEITDGDEFKHAIEKDTFTVVSFSAPWCGNCKTMKPQLAALAEELEPKVAFLKLDADDLEDLFEELEVESFPHFRVYKSGALINEYTGSKFEKVEEFIRANV